MGERKFDLLVDMTCDLEESWFTENNVIALPHGIIISGVEYWDTFDVPVTFEEFYAKMRAGEKMATMQGKYQMLVEEFEGACQKGRDLLYVGLASRVTGTFNTAIMVAKDAMEAYPGAKVICFDTLCASYGQGFVAQEAVRLADQGLTIDEAVEELQKILLRVCHFFTVDDLNHLFRGGRLSRTSAMMGTVMGVKPILHFDKEGALCPLTKVRGRQTAMKELVSLTKKHSTDETDLVYILEADCLDDAKTLESMMHEAGFTNTKIAPVGRTVAIHTGPGVLATVFMGDRMADA